MTEQESHQKKQFTIPNKDELVDLIKNLDEDIQHISLNLIKCDFNATEKDVEKAFPEFKFIKVKNYNPGSFEVVLQMRIDAINFIRTCYDKKILSRRFFIKMGRQHKELIEDWTGVGYAPRQFRPHKNHNKDHPNKQHQNKDFQNKEQRQPREYKKHEFKKPQEKKQVVEGQQKTQQTKPKVQLVKQEKIATQKTQQVKKGKQIPKTDFHKKKNNNYNKPRGEQGQPDNKTQKVSQQVKQEKPVEKVQQKKAQKTATITNKKTVQQKEKGKVAQQATKPVEKVVQKAKVQEKEQDDGWIVVPPKNNAKQKKR